jgi:DNA-binding NtrC family response regulator
VEGGRPNHLAKHRDLAGEIADGGFREDLYDRLWDVILEVPPLRHRREDVPLLVEHVRRQINERHGLSIDRVGPEVLAALQAASWPGNVRELEKVLEEAMILRGRGQIDVDDLRPLARRAAHRAPWSPARHRILPLPLSNPRREAALRLAVGRGTVSRGVLARECGISGETARQELAALARLGHLRRVGHGRRTEYVVR